MNGIDELRSTLDRHAADVVDHDLGGRVGSVHQRVRVVRRRRWAAVAGGAALTLAVVGSVALLSEPSPRRDVQPATVVGLPVPASMDALGYTYAFDRGIEGEGKVSVDLDDSDVPRLVSWGTAGADDRVRVDQAGDVATYDVPDFSDYVWVGPGDGISVSVAGSGQVGLAVYELSSSGESYRPIVADQLLLASRVGLPGMSEATVEVVSRGTTVSYRPFCAGAPDGATMHLELPDGELVVGGCDATVPFDPGAGSSYDVPTVPGADASARLWVSQGEDGPQLDDDEIVVGVAAYGSGATTRIGGFDVPTVFEHEGHMWKRALTHVSNPGDRRVAAEGDDADRPRLALGFHRAGDATVIVEHSATGEGVRAEGVDGGRAVIGLLSERQDVASVRVLGDVPAGSVLAIAIYERMD